MSEQLGQIAAFNEGAVPYREEQLRDLLAQGNPNRLAVQHNMLAPNEDGVRVRWLKSLPAGSMPGRHAVLGEPPIEFAAAVAHVERHERELERLSTYDITIPQHSVFVVERDPYHGWPVVYTAVENIPEPPLLPEKKFFKMRHADPQQLAELGNRLLHFYNDAPAGQRVLHDDGAWPKQFSNCLALYDVEPRLVDSALHGLRTVAAWASTMRRSAERTQLQLSVKEIINNWQYV